MIWRIVFLIVLGGSYGLLAAAGVFTVFVAVGLIPRFAGKTHTAKKIFLYEEMVVLGTLAGAVLTIFPEYLQIGSYVRQQLPQWVQLWDALGGGFQIIFGLFCGMFIGCLALAIAEMLDSIPIFTRRISFRYGISLVILSVAAGKLCGSFLYFWKEMHRLIQ
ncbi:MAG: hypothetical protein E7291_06790 [Lachnospiraceae bacterium]|nr:hypothetical protein [Lachnospiraceae bacterium]